MTRSTAFAKINWYLDITGKRPDGYHTLDTVFQTIALGDELTFSPADALSLACTDPTLPVDERNLAMKAAMRVREALRETRGASIHLKKVTPMGAGLGGGSADAAAVIDGLCRLWGRSLDPAVRHAVAVGLGADVPFFLTGGTCRGTGIGDVLEPLPPVPKTWLVVVWPGFGVATKDAYARVQLPFVDSAPARGLDPRGSLFNRFEALVFPDHPALPRLKQDLRVAGASASLMSGSGSAVFGIVASEAEGERIAKRLRPAYPHLWLTHTL